VSAQVIVGIDERHDAHGAAHPWRIVVMSTRLPGGRIQYLMALPGDRSYISLPRHPLYGDLTLLGTAAATQIAALVATLAAIGATEVHIARGVTDVIGNTLIWNGIEPRMHDASREDGVLLDPFSIGGDAGHQIAIMETKLRSSR